MARIPRNRRRAPTQHKGGGRPQGKGRPSRPCHLHASTYRARIKAPCPRIGATAAEFVRIEWIFTGTAENRRARRPYKPRRAGGGYRTTCRFPSSVDKSHAIRDGNAAPRHAYDRGAAPFYRHAIDATKRQRMQAPPADLPRRHRDPRELHPEPEAAPRFRTPPPDRAKFSHGGDISRPAIRTNPYTLPPIRTHPRRALARHPHARAARQRHRHAEHAAEGNATGSASTFLEAEHADRHGGEIPAYCLQN